MSTISKLLEESLLVIESEDNGIEKKENNNRGELASSVLLQECRNRMELQGSSIKIVEKSNQLSPLLEQAADSVDQSENEWKGLLGKSKQNSKNTKSTPNPAGFKKHQAKIDKGESYKDRFAEKMASKSNRKKRMEKMSKMF